MNPVILLWLTVNLPFHTSMLSLNIQNFTLDADYEEIYEAISKRMLQSLQENYNAGKLDFVDLYKTCSTDDIETFVSQRQWKYDSIVILWIGWSALWAKAILQAIKWKYYNELYHPKIFICDNVDPCEVTDIMDCIDLDRTLFFVISKSGSTIETRASYQFFRKLYLQKGSSLSQHFCFITDKNSSLHDEGIQENIPCFFIPKNIGGRFSVLSNVWLLPLAFCGIDIKKLLKWLEKYKQDFFSSDLEKNLALKLALIQYFSYKNGKEITVFFPYIANFKSFGEWYKQLFWESLWKEGIGANLFTSVWATDQHSDLQLFIEWPQDKLLFFLETETFNNDNPIFDSSDLSFWDLMRLEKYGTELSLTNSGVLNITLKIDAVNEESLGTLIAIFEYQVAFLWWLFKINIYNQPWVEEWKEIVRQKLKEKFGNIL